MPRPSKEIPTKPNYGPAASVVIGILIQLPQAFNRGYHSKTLTAFPPENFNGIFWSDSDGNFVKQSYGVYRRTYIENGIFEQSYYFSGYAKPEIYASYMGIWGCINCDPTAAMNTADMLGRGMFEIAAFAVAPEELAFQALRSVRFMQPLLRAKNFFRTGANSSVNRISKVEDWMGGEFLDDFARMRGSRELVKYDPQFAVSQALNGGKFDFDKIRVMIPKGTPNTFSPTLGGEKYLFSINGTKVQLKWHTPEFSGVPPLGSNSSLFNTAQIKVGNRYLKQYGGFMRNQFSNETHIPLK